MKWKIDELIIDGSDPFKNDILGRKENAEILTQLITTIEEPFVMALNSAWGTGKTTFVKMWSQHLRNNAFHTIYYNAWENDYSEDAFASLIAELKGYLVIAFKDKKDIRNKIEKVMDVGKKVLKASIPAIIKQFSGVNEKTIEGIIAAITQKSASKKITDYQLLKKEINDFRSKLSELVVLMNKDTAIKKPLVFFIDELDRCRPIYTVELLEKVKHLFNIPGLVFILSIDKAQLVHSIGCLYGQGMDSDGYLRRFIDLEYTLPEPIYEKYIDYLFEIYSFNSITQCQPKGENNNLKTISGIFFKAYEASLRVQQQIYSQIRIIAATLKEREKLHPEFLLPLLVLKKENIDIYEDIINKRTHTANVARELEKNFMLKKYLISKSISSMIFSAYLVWSLNSQKEYRGKMKEYEVRKTELSTTEEKQKYNEMIDYLNDSLISRDLIKYLKKKIDMSDSFVKL